MKTAYLFPGQGAQVVSMGLEIARSFPAAADIFQKADNLIGYDLSRICFEGPAEQLNSTTISQPAIFTTSAAILEVLRTSPAANDLVPDVTAGLSLGEYTALYAAGLISFEDVLALVQKRGQAMQTAADATEGAMVSVIGLDEEKTNMLCAKASHDELLEPVNFNCPGQIVISGTKAACARAEELAPQFGAIKAITLDVAGAFHTQMMSSAADALHEALSNCRISPPRRHQGHREHQRRVLHLRRRNRKGPDKAIDLPHPVAKIYGKTIGRRRRKILRNRPRQSPHRTNEKNKQESKCCQPQQP